MSNNSVSIGGNASGPIAVGDGASAVSHGPLLPGPVGQRAGDSNHAEPRPQVFLSYQRTDRHLVLPILAGLRTAGISVWFDGDLVGGTAWPLEVKRAVASCNAFVACFSPRYVDRRRSYMHEELRQATAQRRLMPADARWLVPVLLEPCELPDLQIDSTTSLPDIQHIDFSTDWDAAMAGLVAALRALI